MIRKHPDRVKAPLTRYACKRCKLPMDAKHLLPAKIAYVDLLHADRYLAVSVLTGSCKG